MKDWRGVQSWLERAENLATKGGASWNLGSESHSYGVQGSWPTQAEVGPREVFSSLS